MDQYGESWSFRVNCPHADRVFLVQVFNGSSKSLIPMNPVGQDTWELKLGLPPGFYEFSYFSAEGDVFINGGTHGLTIHPPLAPDPNVVIQSLNEPVSV